VLYVSLVPSRSLSPGFGLPTLTLERDRVLIKTFLPHLLNDTKTLYLKIRMLFNLPSASFKS